MKRILLTIFLLIFGAESIIAQMAIDLNRIETLAKDSTNTEFLFENLKERFIKKNTRLITTSIASLVLSTHQ
ncbi:hypothetical protein [Faecalibacter sp. LW9]|uniref:hypothetical protein n=1 Tax=Faecalibacter sp. LW9 TaxID=3103144 RepID=UPI002AFF0956|nr:hypothetical protein [Faecalibacter sp. LW9]